MGYNESPPMVESGGDERARIKSEILMSVNASMLTRKYAEDVIIDVVIRTGLREYLQATIHSGVATCEATRAA